ncbi:MAG: SNF2-related protein [Kiritimatiellia bacterium]
MQNPQAGQRWMSTSEPELGLGLVLEADRSMVRLLFPAVGEMRKYALGSAPLKRVSFTKGDEVEDHQGRSLRVEEVLEEGELLVYKGEGRLLPEAELGDQLLQQGPGERLLMGQLDTSDDFERRLKVWTQRHRLATHPALGLMGGRIDWIPHQIAIAHELSRRVHPRVLLADEVGLGKTIEACLVLHHALVTGRAKRALILVPEPLVHQWFVELLRRFHLMFRIYDAERCEAFPDENPFLREQWVLCSLDLLSESPKWAEAAAEAGWDMLIVDEAHHLAWSPDRPGAAYSVVEALAVTVPGVLLLTATPEQMGLESHFAHLRLLDPDRHDSFEAFKREQEGYVRLAEEGAELHAAGNTDELRRLLRGHGPGRVMFRNTRDWIQGFPQRIAHPVELKNGENAKERWLVGFLNGHADEKVLVITRTVAQVKALDEQLRAFLDPAPVLFHEEQTLLERDRQAAWFADTEGARVLITSDIGGEGRNFQFVRHLVLFDIPADPERVEQRIGRLDRIGQQSDIQIHLPVIEGSREAGVLRWLNEGLQAFTRPLQCGHRCLEIFRDRLDSVDDTLIEESRVTVERLEAEQRSGRNRLLQWKHELAEDVETELRQLREMDDDPELVPFVEDLWGGFGLEVEKLHPNVYVVKPGPFYRGELTVREEGVRFTPDRKQALEREDLELLTWDHPLVRDGMEALLSSRSGGCACARGTDIETPHLQVLFILEAPAPSELQVNRFLPPTPILFTLDTRGRKVEEAPQAAGDHDGGSLVAHPGFRNEWLPDRLRDAERKAGGVAKRLRENAIAEAGQLLGAEIERLKDLRKINDHVRAAEIDILESQQLRIREALQQARPRLDAIRLMLP